MRLAEWRRERRMTQSELASAIGCTQSAISNFERADTLARSQIPGPDLIVAIYRLTRGAVTPNDFYSLPPLDQLELPMTNPAPAPLLEGAE
jgi:transcriptional regulator with XRE-family HTH domain